MPSRNRSTGLEHCSRRARIAFSDSAAKQLDSITSEAEPHALDRALVVLSVDPDAGELLPGDSPDHCCVSTSMTSNASGSCTA